MTVLDDSSRGLKREVAELKRRLAERESELVASSEVLQVINSSPGDLAPVFDAILERAMRLCEADYGHVYTFDGQQFHAVAIKGQPEFVSWRRQRGPIRPEGDGTSPLERLIAGERVLQVADVCDERAYRTHPRFRELVDTSGIRSMATVALHKEDSLLGAIIVYRREVQPFSEQQIALLRNFAAQAVIAIENARLITETREALEQQTATAELLGVINASRGDLPPVFDAMLASALRLCGAPYGNLLTYDGEFFRIVAAVHGDGRIAEQQRNRPPFRIMPTALLAQLVRGEQMEFSEDVRESESYRLGASFRELIDAGGYRSVLNVALRNDRVLVGAIGIFRSEFRPFSEKEIALVQNFAAQAVIAMENARLITETREALEQQTATAEVLSVINSSPGDLSPVFDAMLEKATRLCNAPFGQLAIYDGGLFRFVAAHGEEAFALNLQREPHPPSDGVTWLRILGGENVVHVPDVRDTDLYRSGHLRTREFVDNGHGRSLLSVALRRDETLLGVLSIYRQQPQPFTDKQIALLQNFAAQAVIAMENARLITETREALEQQTATAEVLGVINSSPGKLEPVFDAMLERAVALCNSVFGHLYLYDGTMIDTAAVRGEARFVDWMRQRKPFPPPPGTLISEVFLDHKDVVRCSDATEHPAYTQTPIFRELIDIGHLRSVLIVALRKDDRFLGSIAVYRQEVHPYAERDVAVLQNFAAQAVIAIENARLLGELRQRTDEVAELNRGLEARVAEQVEELGRVGRLKRFLAPQLAEMIVSQGDENILESHRREIVVVFCDLRGYTAFTETAEPEEVLDFLREYHGALGPLVSQFEGTLDQFSGDGIMVFFNDPVPVPDPAERAVKMAIAMRETANRLIATWRQRDRELGFGAGIAQGYATLGQIGFADRSGYTAIGTVCNLAARLCGEAKDGQILVAGRVAAAVRETTALEDIGPLVLKGLTQPVSVFNVKGLIAG